MRRVAAIALVACLPLAGCGGGTKRTPEEKAFIARVDDSCRAYIKARAAAGLVKAPRPTDLAARAVELDKRAGLRQTQLTGFQAITAPARDRTTYKSFVSVYSQRVA